MPEVDKSEPIKPTPAPPKSGIISSGNVLGIIATVGGALFICNLCLLYCYVKRRAGKHIFGEFLHSIKSFLFSGDPPPDARRSMVNSLLEEKSEIPFIIIASVSVGGVFLLIINIVLLHCFIQKRKADNSKDNISIGMFESVFLFYGNVIGFECVSLD